MRHRTLAGVANENHFSLGTTLLVEVMSVTSTCMNFPCSFPLKVMGHNNHAFESAVQAVIKKHLQETPVIFERRASGSGKYLSVTATFTATSREQLDALYRELNAHELVVMTL
jgi:putative lipoic acid-binding regulatory protein